MVTVEFEEEEEPEPQTISSQPLSSKDDAEEAADGSMNRFSSDLELTEENSLQTVGIRFPELDIPQGATIQSAEIIFTVDEATDEATSLEFAAEASDDAASFSSTDFDISDRSQTDASVEWTDIAPWTTVNAEHTTPDLSDIIQEVIDRSDWQRGNALAVLISGSGSRVAVSFNKDPNKAPYLMVTYTSDDEDPNEEPSNTPPSVDNPGTQTNTIGDSAHLVINATDADGDTLTYSAAGLPDGLDIDPATELIDGTLNSIETTSVTVTVSDGLDSSDQTFTWNVLSDDPTNQIIAAQPQNSSDDAEERLDGTVALRSSDLELIADAEDQTVGIRFPNLALPQGATIVDAYIEFTVDETSAEPTSLAFHAEASDDAELFRETLGDVSGRPLSTARLEWTDIAPWDVIDAVEQTPNLAALVQEVVDRANWQTGSALAVIISGSGSRVAVSYNGDPTKAPRLVIQYTSDATQTVTAHIESRDNDAEEGPDGTLNLSSSDLELVVDTDAGIEQLVGLRFTDVMVPNGAQIVDAYIEFSVDEVTTESTNLEITAEASANAAAFSDTAFDLSDRQLIAASVDWNDVTAWDVVDATQQTPNLADLVQEVVDQPAWQHSNALALLITGSGGRTAVSRDGDVALAPRLIITYTLP